MIKKIINLRNICLLFLLLIFFVSTSKIIGFIADTHINNKNNKALIEDVFALEIDSTTKEEKITVDFAKLIAINTDVVGWIRANNGKINYPIVQAKTNDYYLNKSFDKKYNQAGSIFLDYRNKANFNDKNVVLFGHSMLDKTMFGSLNDVFKQGFLDNKDNAIIQIIDGNNKVLTYQIFSYYIIDKEEYYITTSFKDENEFQVFLDTIKDRSIKKANITLSPNDKILTLSTCAGTGGTEKRKVVHAKRIYS